jgi:hypothetical protein
MFLGIAEASLMWSSCRTYLYSSPAGWAFPRAPPPGTRDSAGAGHPGTTRMNWVHERPPSNRSTVEGTPAAGRICCWWGLVWPCGVWGSIWTKKKPCGTGGCSVWEDLLGWWGLERWKKRPRRRPPQPTPVVACDGNPPWWLRASRVGRGPGRPFGREAGRRGEPVERDGEARDPGGRRGCSWILPATGGAGRACSRRRPGLEVGGIREVQGVRLRLCGE